MSTYKVSRRTQLLVMVLIFGSVGALLCVKYRRTRPVIFLGTGHGTYKKRIAETLDNGSAASSQPPEALERPLLKLTPRNGGAVTILVLGGYFEDSTISPQTIWTKHLHDGRFLLVNSVDEAQTVETEGIARPIGRGCGLEQYVDNKRLLNLSDVKIHRCGANSPYARIFGQGKVANTANVIYRGTDSAEPDRAPCWDAPTSDLYGECVRNAVENSLNNLFGPRHFDELNDMAVVMPALGTGHGNMDADDFYSTLVGKLKWTLSEIPRPWSARIIILVNSQDRDWVKTKGAIAGNFGDLAEAWNSIGPKGNVSDLLFTAGVALTLALCLAAFSVLPAAMLPSSFKLLSTMGPIPLSISWFAAAVGLTALCHEVTTLLEYEPTATWVYGVAGAISVFACTFLMRALEGFKENVVHGVDASR